MSANNDGSGKGPVKPPTDTAAPKKPTALIDLKATEVKSSDGTPQPDVRAAAQAPAAAATVDIKSTTAAGMASVPPMGKPADKLSSSVPPTTKPIGPPAAANKSAPAPSGSVPPAQAKSGGGIGAVATHLFAGIAGGFLALLGADTIGPQLGLSGPGAGVADLTKRLALIEDTAKTKTATPSTDVAQKLAAAEARVAKLEEAGRALPAMTAAQTKLAADTKALSDKLDKPTPGADAEKLAKLEDVLQTLAAAANTDPQRGRIPQLAQISGKLADLETTLNGQMAAVRKSVTQDVEARLGQATEAAEQARAGTQRIDREMATIKTDTARATQRLDGVDQLVRTLKEDTAAMKADFGQMATTVTRPQDVSSALAPLTTKLASVEQNLAGVVKNEDDRRANAERIVLALELANLKRALDRGGAFAPELAAVQKAGGAKLDLKALDAVKDRGVATTTTLATDFRQVAYALIAADAEPADGSVVDRLVAGAKSIVRVRKSSSDPTETTAEAIAARMDASLKAGRLAEISTEAAKLSPKARAATAPWLAKVEARAGVDKAVADIETQLKAALSGK